jgi:hypothetical protein
MWDFLSDERTVYHLQLLLVLASAIILGDRILLCQIRDSPNLKDQVPIYISRRNWVTQLYLQALGSLFVASYDSQGRGGGCPCCYTFRPHMGHHQGTLIT